MVTTQEWAHHPLLRRVGWGSLGEASDHGVLKNQN